MLALFTSCGTLDLTKEHIGESPICEIHNCTMTPEYIYVGGELCYLPDYQEIANQKFPNHGGQRFNHETKETPRFRDFIGFVCPECDKAFHQYWKEERRKEAEQIQKEEK